MAISPPSDILLDVASAADPVRLRAATARLAKLAAEPTASNEGFGKALAAASGDLQDSSSTKADRTSASASAVPSTGGPTLTRQPSHSKDVYQKFEAVLLQNFVESMLPKDDDTFGDKNTAGAYRSMMAEQLAGQLAKAGGIGIAKAVEKAHPDPAQASVVAGKSVGIKA
jgi:hypothetical protein